MVAACGVEPSPGLGSISVDDVVGSSDLGRALAKLDSPGSNEAIRTCLGRTSRDFLPPPSQPYLPPPPSLHSTKRTDAYLFFVEHTGGIFCDLSVAVVSRCWVSGLPAALCGKDSTPFVLVCKRLPAPTQDIY